VEQYTDSFLLKKLEQTGPANYKQALKKMKELKVQLYKPKFFNGDVSTYKDTEIIAILGNPDEFQTKEVYSIDKYYNFLRARYNTSSVRTGWVTNEYKVLPYRTKYLYELRSDHYYSTSIFKLAGLGNALFNKTIILYGKQKPYKAWLKYLYEVIGNITIIHVRPMGKTERQELGKIYWNLPTVSEVVNENPKDLMNSLKEAQGVITSLHMVYGVKINNNTSTDTKVVVDVYDYEQSFEVELHEPQVTEGNKYKLCDQEIYISDRKLDILMEFHRIIDPSEEWDDILDITQDENNETVFSIKYLTLKHKQMLPGVTKQDVLDCLKLVKEIHEVELIKA